MKRLNITLVILMVAVPCFGLFHATKVERQAKDKEEIQALMRRWDDALVKRDVKFIESILAEDFTYISSSGEVQGKAEHLALIKSPDLMVESSSSSNFLIRIYDSAAVAFAEGSIRGRHKSSSFDNRYRYTDIWVRGELGWKAVATQITDLPR